mmetsp:Transcript_3835/g.9332  ORF Transcript_3835/g.9332 Transcript_3835/m.9332 type:complete len:237 (+) Transcript_3835:425-1135(+)
MAHHIAALGDLERDGELLLDQQHAQPPRLQCLQVFGHQLDDLGRQALGGLVDHDQVGVAHQRAAQRQHLLLATREHAGLGVLALLQAREHPVHVVEAPARRLGATPLLAQHQVLVDGQPGEDIAVLRHIAQAQLRDVVGLAADQLGIAEPDRTLGVDLAHDGLDHGRAAGAVAAEQGDDLAGLDGQVDAVQDVAFAVPGVEVGDVEGGGGHGLLFSLIGGERARSVHCRESRPAAG